MSWSNLFGILISFSLLTGCGFRPLHTSLGRDCTACYPIKIATIPDRYGQILRNNLLDLLTPTGQPCAPKYILEVKLQEVLLDTGVAIDETITRKQLTLTADITLRDRCYNVLYTHTIFAVNSFPVIEQNYYANAVTESYAQKEGLERLAYKIKLLISAYLENHGEN